MKYKQTTILIVAAATLVTGSALAADIYRYVDAEGNVNYVDRPTGAESEKRLAIASKPGEASRNPVSYADARNSRDAADQQTPEGASAAPGGAAPEKLTRAEKKAARRELQQRCQSYRDRLDTLVTSRRLYREDENGERIYLDDSETQEASDKVRQLIAETCN